MLIICTAMLTKTILEKEREYLIGRIAMSKKKMQLELGHNIWELSFRKPAHERKTRLFGKYFTKKWSNLPSEIGQHNYI